MTDVVVKMNRDGHFGCPDGDDGLSAKYFLQDDS